MQQWYSRLRWFLLVTPIFLAFIPVKHMNLVLYTLGYLAFGLASYLWIQMEE